MQKEKLLIHCCCAPCSSAIIEYLLPYYDITLYFYNPNITDREEYENRVDELKYYVQNILKGDVDLVCEEYKTEAFYDSITGYENSHEGSSRCRICYCLRLQKTADYALSNNYSQFTTTLTLSPYKDSAVINSIGTAVASKHKGLMYMPFDFGFLYTRSLELCSKYDLYQQDYCGCEFSKK